MSRFPAHYCWAAGFSSLSLAALLYLERSLMGVFDDIEIQECWEMAEYSRLHNLPNEDLIEAGREWFRHGSKSAAWEYLRECAELEAA